MVSERGVSVALGLAASACLVGANPDFGATTMATTTTESGSSGNAETGTSGSGTETGTETGEPIECPAGTLDCDDEPGCEADAGDPATCGSCDKSCALAGEWLFCEAGTCSGTIELGELPDTYVDSEDPAGNNNGETQLLVDSQPSVYHSYIAIPDVGDFPPEAEILDAELLLYCSEGGSDVGIHRVTTGWSVDTATWLTRPQVEAEAVIVFEAQTGPVSSNITSIVSAWVDGAPNHGLALVATSIDGSDYHASESGMGPRLTVTASW